MDYNIEVLRYKLWQQLEEQISFVLIVQMHSHLRLIPWFLHNNEMQENFLRETKQWAKFQKF